MRLSEKQESYFRDSIRSQIAVLRFMQRRSKTYSAIELQWQKYMILHTWNTRRAMRNLGGI